MITQRTSTGFGAVVAEKAARDCSVARAQLQLAERENEGFTVSRVEQPTTFSKVVSASPQPPYFPLYTFYREAQKIAERNSATEDSFASV